MARCTLTRSRFSFSYMRFAKVLRIACVPSFPVSSLAGEGLFQDAPGLLAGDRPPEACGSSPVPSNRTRASVDPVCPSASWSALPATRSRPRELRGARDRAPLRLLLHVLALHSDVVHDLAMLLDVTNIRLSSSRNPEAGAVAHDEQRLVALPNVPPNDRLMTCTSSSVSGRHPFMASSPCGDESHAGAVACQGWMVYHAGLTALSVLPCQREGRGFETRVPLQTPSGSLPKSHAPIQSMVTTQPSQR